MKIFLVSTALLGFGCVAAEVDPEPEFDPASPELDEDLPPQTEAALTNNTRTAFEYFKTKGLTEIQSAGIVGNLIQESSVNPSAVQYGGGPGRGIAQWSVGGRWDRGTKSLVTYANAHGVSRWALTTQLDFIWYELATVGGYGLPQLRAATTVTSAVAAFQNKYEICGACNQTNRVNKANEVLRTYGGTGGGTTPTTGGCYSATLGMQMPENACVQARSDGEWYQCNAGTWIDRYSDPDPCNGEHPLQ